MNFLAHLLTGDSSEDLMAGSFAGDFCRGRLDRHPLRLRTGILLHRAVDAFADLHPQFSAMRSQLRPAVGLYAAVAADMLIDHVLARDWEEWAGPGETLAAFSRRSAQILTDFRNLLPPDGRRVAEWMDRGEWLTSYATSGGIRTALRRMNGRVRGEIDLERAVDVFERDEGVFERDASEFLAGLFADPGLRSFGMRQDLAGSHREPNES